MKDKIWLGLGTIAAGWLIAQQAKGKNTTMEETSTSTSANTRINNVSLNDSATIHFDLAQGDQQLSPHFKLSEFRSRKRGGGYETKGLIHPALIFNLEKLREQVRVKYPGAICQVNSGYRTPEWNKIVGGETQSRHMYGLASDVVFKVGGRVVPPSVVASIAESMQFGGVGRYNTFTHVDVNSEGGHLRRWDKTNE